MVGTAVVHGFGVTDIVGAMGEGCTGCAGLVGAVAVYEYANWHICP